MSRPVLWCLVAVITVAATLRLGATSGTVVDHPVRADAAEYLAYAYNLRNRGVYSRLFTQETPPPDAHRSPGYPLFLLPFSEELPSERSVYLITLAQALIGTLTVLLTFRLLRLWMGQWAALAGAVLTALSPHLVTAGTYVLTETLFCLALTVLAYLAARVSDRSKLGYLLLVGAALGAATLVRPSLQYFLPVLAALLVAQFGWRAGARMAAVATLGFALMFAPWVARNLASIGHWTDSQLTTSFLHHGMYPDFRYDGQEESYGFPYRFDPQSPTIEASTGNALSEIARRFVEDPTTHLRWYLLGKPVAFFGWDIVNGYGDVFVYPVVESPYVSNPVFAATRSVMRTLHWPLMAFAALGALLAWVPGRPSNGSADSTMAARVCSAIALYFLAIHIVGAPFPRYSVPLRPLTFGLAMYGVWRLAAPWIGARLGTGTTPAPLPEGNTA